MSEQLQQQQIDHIKGVSYLFDHQEQLHYPQVKKYNKAYRKTPAEFKCIINLQNKNGVYYIEIERKKKHCWKNWRYLSYLWDGYITKQLEEMKQMNLFLEIYMETGKNYDCQGQK